MIMATSDERITILETKLETELRHLATKADLERLENRLTRLVLVTIVPLMIAVIGNIVYQVVS